MCQFGAVNLKGTGILLVVDRGHFKNGLLLNRTCLYLGVNQTIKIKIRLDIDFIGLFARGAQKNQAAKTNQESFHRLLLN